MTPPMRRFVLVYALRAGIPMLILVAIAVRSERPLTIAVPLLVVLVVPALIILGVMMAANRKATAADLAPTAGNGLNVARTPDAEGEINNPFASSLGTSVGVDAQPPLSKRGFARAMVFAGAVSLAFPFMLGPTVDWFTEEPLLYAGIALGFWALVVALAYWGQKIARRRVREAKRWGWKQGSGGLWQGIDAMPINGGALVPTSGIHGMWRGRRAESTLLSPSRRGLDVFGAPLVSRVEVMELAVVLPRVEIARHGTNRLAAVGGVDQLDVESPEFNKNFRVVSPNLPFAHAVLHPRMMERLLRDDARELAITIVGNRIMVWSSPPDSLDGMEARLNVMADVIDLLPDFAFEKWGSGGPTGALPARQSTGEKNWLGWTALVLGIGLLAPLAIPFGHLALRATQRGQATNRGAAVYGLVMGYFVTAIMVVAAFMTAAK